MHSGRTALPLTTITSGLSPCWVREELCSMMHAVSAHPYTVTLCCNMDERIPDAFISSLLPQFAGQIILRNNIVVKEPSTSMQRMMFTDGLSQHAKMQSLASIRIIGISRYTAKQRSRRAENISERSIPVCVEVLHCVAFLEPGIGFRWRHDRPTRFSCNQCLECSS